MCLVIEGDDPAVDAEFERIAKADEVRASKFEKIKAELQRDANRIAYFDEVFNTLESHARWFQDFVKGNPEHEVRARELLRIVERNRV